ncbi:hypothetical protein [Flavobacterium sp. NRK1]|nr:hypothetical protein [Flavobacterium sp. NRK1]MCO6149068.1 hypothetical protein [Flavobacterium sp. NRK1]
MATALTAEEFEAICQFFHECGVQGIDFKTALNMAKKESLRLNQPIKTE